MSVPRWYAVAGPAYLAALLAVDTQVGLQVQLVLGAMTWRRAPRGDLAARCRSCARR